MGSDMCIRDRVPGREKDSALSAAYRLVSALATQARSRTRSDATRARIAPSNERARIASLRVRLRTSVAGAETRRYAAESASRGSGARPTATAR